MSLQNATVEQLLQWQADIGDEMARRMVQRPEPVVPRPPWAIQAAAVIAKREPLQQQETPEQLMVRAQQMMDERTSRNAPQLLPGVRMTARSDPKLAAMFAAVPHRPDGVPGIAGSGHGEGMIELGPTGS